MFRNYLTIALRTLWRQRVYSFINVFGLAVGLAGSFFILIWVQDELSYNRYLKDGDHIHLVRRNVKVGERIYTGIVTPKPLAEALKTDYPDIAEVVQTRWPQRFIVTRGEQNFREAGNYAGEAFFNVFRFPFIEGNPKTALKDESSVVITDRTARKIFGENWRQKGGVLGQILNIDHRKDFIITGVIDNIPENTFDLMQFDVLLPIQEYFARNTLGWNINNFLLYVKLKDHASLTAVNEKIADVVAKHYEEGANEIIFLQPFEDIYLYSDYRDGKLVGGRIEYVRIFMPVAAFLLSIAIINFMNLTTARSAQRAREIGIRKAIGADRQSLIVQFLGEAVLVALIAFGFSIGIVESLLPFFNELTQKHISFVELNGGYLLVGLGIAVLVGLLAGSYPALYLSSFNPNAALRGAFRQRLSVATMRKVLVIFQFGLSVLLITATITVYRQIQYIRDKDWGLDHGNVVSIPLEGTLMSQYEVFRDVLLKQPGISNVTSADFSPLNIRSNTLGVTWEGKSPDDKHQFSLLNINYDFVETMKMKLIAGRTFSKAFGTDTSSYIINEVMAKILGGNVLGKPLELWGRTGTVIGVVGNFFMYSLYEPIEPVIILLRPNNTRFLFIRTMPGQTGMALSSLEATCKQFNPSYPLNFTFLDREFENIYKSEVIMGMLANICAVIAIFISCLGIFGLVSFTTEQRTKEIGLRKTLGATVPYLVLLLTREVTKLVFMSIVITLPIAYYMANKWLATFQYHITLGFDTFVLAGVLTMAIALLTVSYQAIKAARANPVDSLRYE